MALFVLILFTVLLSNHATRLLKPIANFGKNGKNYLTRYMRRTDCNVTSGSRSSAFECISLEDRHKKKRETSKKHIPLLTKIKIPGGMRYIYDFPDDQEGTRLSFSTYYENDYDH